MNKEKVNPQEYLSEEDTNLRIVSLKCQTEEVIFIKGNLLDFIIDKHFSSEFDDFMRTHDMASEDCPEIIPKIEDPLTEAQKEYEGERNIKNNMYRFIIDHGLFSQLKEYNLINGIKIPDGRIHALAGVVRTAFHKSKRSDNIVKRHNHK